MQPLQLPQLSSKKKKEITASRSGYVLVAHAEGGHGLWQIYSVKKIPISWQELYPQLLSLLNNSFFMTKEAGESIPQPFGLSVFVLKPCGINIVSQ